MKRKAKNILVSVVFLIGITVSSIHFVFSESANRNRFEQITAGMTETAVINLLGDPTTVSRENKATTLGYGGFLRNKWCTMQVFLGPDGRVTGKFHDH